jgi:hypothetical protein
MDVNVRESGTTTSVVRICVVVVVVVLTTGDEAWPWSRSEAINASMLSDLPSPI